MIEKIEDDLLKISLNNEIKINIDRVDALNKTIYNYLMDDISLLYEITLKNNELNLIALKKEDKKYEFIHQLITENIQITRENNKIYRFLLNSLENIEKICSSENEKRRTVNNFIESLLEEE